MTNPFPGMNPWLEHPPFWGDVHSSLISALARHTSPLVSPRYYVTVGTQVYTATPSSQAPITSTNAPAPPEVDSIIQVPVPGVIEQAFLEIRKTKTDQVVTVIEILSPTIKRPGVSRQKYERKRLKLFGTHTHLVEIDLLRAWEPMPFMGHAPSSHYRILVRRREQDGQTDLYLFNVRDTIPGFPLPLQADDVEPLIDLNALLDDVYVQASYDARIDYQQALKPPLTRDEAKWAREIVAKRDREL